MPILTWYIFKHLDKIHPILKFECSNSKNKQHIAFHLIFSIFLVKSRSTETECSKPYLRVSLTIAISLCNHNLDTFNHIQKILDETLSRIIIIKKTKTISLFDRKLESPKYY